MGAKIMKSEAVRVGWRDVLDDVIAGTDILVERYNKPVAAVIGHDVYVALQEEIEDLRLGLRAQAALDEYDRDPSLARPWEEVKAEWHTNNIAPKLN
jgi:antitoxin (DNA-binding transcriptional repressor) of toxin-antitoxin stability system